jgi:hypothetical protein
MLREEQQGRTGRKSLEKIAFSYELEMQSRFMAADCTIQSSAIP